MMSEHIQEQEQVFARDDSLFVNSAHQVGTVGQDSGSLRRSRSSKRALEGAIILVVQAI